MIGSFAREWVKQGHEVVVIVNSSAFPSFYYRIGNVVKSLITKTFDVSRMPDRLWIKRFAYEEAGVHVENIPIKKYIPHGRFSRAALHNQLQTIAEILETRDFQPDAVVGHWVNPQLMLVAALAKKYHAQPAFVFHADYVETTCKKFAVQSYIDQIDCVGFRSKSAAEAAKGYLHFRREPFIVASGIPDAFIEQYRDLPERRFDRDGFRLITAARLVEYKRIDAVLGAMAKAFPRGTTELTIAGSGPQQEKLCAQAQDAGILERIRFLGQIPREALQEQMRSSDVFVLISEHETFGLVYLEAMLHGCIVIASRFGGVDGIIEHGVNGFLCAEGCEEELVTILQNIQTMAPSEKQAMSRRAYETAMQYSESAAARRYLDNLTGKTDTTESCGSGSCRQSLR